MAGEKSLTQLMKGMSPKLNEGEYVFVSVEDINEIDRELTICEFKEEEGVTIVIEKSKADELKLTYEFIASWITIEIHSSLEAIGFTAAFSAELSKNHISCNFISGYYHDHIFVERNDSDKALRVLNGLSKSHK